MKTIKIKALSVNEAYSGRRYSTKKLMQFKKDLLYLLPKMKIPKGELGVRYQFGVSSSGADGDNLIKAFQDCLGEIYGFNDNRIYRWVIEKVKVKKGEEFISFEIY